MINQDIRKPQESSDVTELYDYIALGTRKSRRRMPMYVGVTMFSSLFVVFLIIVPLVMTATGVPTIEALKYGVIADVIASTLAFALYRLMTPHEAAGLTKAQEKTQEDIQRTRDAVALMDAQVVPEYTLDHVDAYARLTRALRRQTERTEGAEWDEGNAHAAAALLFEDLDKLNIILGMVRVGGIVDAAELRRRVEA